MTENAPAAGSAPSDVPAVLGLLQSWLTQAVPAETLAWITAEIAGQQAAPDERRLVIALGLAGRKLRRIALALPPQELALAQRACPDWQPQHWAADEMMHAALLLAGHHDDDAAFAKRLEKLLLTAEISERVSFMKGVAVFPAGELLLGCVRDSVRSSIGPVFRAVACHNPYPRRHFDQDGWNQMVVKCVFEGVPIADIVGADARRNPELLIMLRDLVSERHAAGRPLPPAVHRFIAGDER